MAYKSLSKSIHENPHKLWISPHGGKIWIFESCKKKVQKLIYNIYQIYRITV